MKSQCNWLIYDDVRLSVSKVFGPAMITGSSRQSHQYSSTCVVCEFQGQLEIKLWLCLRAIVELVLMSCGSYGMGKNFADWVWIQHGLKSCVMIDDFFGWYVSMIWWAHLEPMVFHFVCVDLWGELLYFCGQLLPVWSVAVDDLLTIRRRFPYVVRQLLFTGLLGNLQSVQFILQGLSKYKKVNGVGNKVKEDGQWTETRFMFVGNHRIWQIWEKCKRWQR